MAKVKIKASVDDFENTGQDRGDFALPPKGLYVLTLSELTPGFSKDEDGKPDRKRPRLEAVWEITGVGRENEPVEANYGNVWDYVSFNPKSGWKRADFLYALGLAEERPDEDVEFEVDTDEVVGTQIIARLKHERGRGPDQEPRAKIATMWPISEAGDDASFDGSGEASDEDAFESAGDEDSPFGDDDTTEEAPEEEASLADALEEMDLKELGSEASEYGVDPNEHVVRFKSGAKKGKVDPKKTKVAVIAAILEAAEAGDEEESEDEDDSPF